MTPPRVFVKRGKFWIEYYEGKSKVRKATRFELDLTPPKFLRDDPTWWKRSKHRTKIALALQEIEIDRLAEELDLPLRDRQTYQLSLEELLQDYNIQNEIEKDSARSKFTLSHRKSAVIFLQKLMPNASILLTRDEVLELRDRAKQDYAPASVRGYLLELRLLFKFAVRRGYIKTNPFDSITIAVRRMAPREIYIEDEQKIFTWLYRHSRPAFYQFMFQRLNALRLSDTCSIKSASIDRTHQRFAYYNSKARRDEICPLSAASRFLLKKAPAGDYLFHYRDKDNLAKELKRAVVATGIQISSHQFKRSALQEFARAKPEPSERTMEALGHHAPTVNRLAVESYIGRDIELMREVQLAAQKPWESFLKRLLK